MPEWWTELAVPITWPVVVLLALVAFGIPVWTLLRTFASQIEDAEQVEASFGGARVTMLRRELPSVPPDNPQLTSDESLVSSPVRKETREAYDQFGERQRGVHLVHTLAPSEVPGQKYQVFLYLVGHQRSRFKFPDNLSDVVAAEFYLGRKWQDQVFSVAREGHKLLGLNAHAYGPFLCVCCVTFKDGGTAVMYRYVDFEAGKALTTRRRARRRRDGRSPTGEP